MTREEAIRHIGDVINIENNSIKPIVIFEQEKEALYMAIEALQNLSKPNNGLQGSDLISRQDAIDALGEEPEIWNDTEEEWAYRNAWVEHISAIKALPSADRPTGEWIKSDILPNGWHCSHCDAPVMTDDIDEMLFCPHCGAKMGGDSDG